MGMNKEVSKVIVAYPDRLTRFGFKTLEDFFKSYGTEIVVINKKANFAGKLYRMRRHKYRKVVKGAKKLLQDP